MKKILIVLVSLFFIVGNVFSQKTNDDGSTGGSTDRNTPQNETNDRTDGGGTTTDNQCLTTALSVTGVLLGAYQQDLLASSNKRPWVSSVELIAEGGFMGDALNLLPRVKLNYGAISADLRYDYISYDGGYTNQNVDVLAEFNIIVKDVKVAIGQGVLYSTDISKSFHQSFLGIEVGLDKRQIIVSPEFRYTYDWENSTTISSEVSLKGAYRIMKTSKMAVYVNATGGYRYYVGDDNIIVSGGVNLVFM